MICTLLLISIWRSNQTTPDHVPDIYSHLIITPDRANTSNSEYSSSPCLDHQNIDFWGNWDKKRRGLLQTQCNGKFFWITSRLFGPQEGLSISTICVEKSVLQITHVVTHVLLGYGLNWDTTFYQNHGFWGLKSDEIGFRRKINNPIDIYQFSINFLRVWRWW